MTYDVFTMRDQWVVLHHSLQPEILEVSEKEVTSIV